MKQRQGLRPRHYCELIKQKELTIMNAFKGSWLLTGVLIAGLAGCASSGNGEKTGAYVDDSWITSKVKSEMIASKKVSARDISVNTTNGVVTLSGTAPTWNESNSAAEIAHGVKGVKSVENDIRIK
jgi:osmotically-inducible protein OsmY